MPDMQTSEYAPMQTLIRLAAAGARGEVLRDICVDWQAVMPLAGEQHMQPLVACALLYSPELDCPPALRKHLLDSMRAQSSMNIIRRQRILQLLQDMQAAGITARVLKGYAVAGCYAHPECRGSVDTDLLIDPAQESQAVRLFDHCGFRITPRAATSHHTVCQHKRYGAVELHIALYAELYQDVWFQAVPEDELVQEPPVTVQSAEGPFMTLGHTDQLLFLTLHMVKHFIMGGLTLRMMLDIALYFHQHRDAIQAERYWQVLRKLNYATLVSSVLGIMTAYGGFDAADFPGMEQVPHEHLRLLLEDMIQGGYMGVKQTDVRTESGMEYNRQMLLKSRSQGQYSRYMLLWKVRTAAGNTFLSLPKLHKTYPFTRQHKAAIPFVWLYHMVAYPIGKIRQGVLRRDIHTENSQRTDAAEKRIGMFRTLGML